MFDQELWVIDAMQGTDIPVARVGAGRMAVSSSSPKGFLQWLIQFAGSLSAVCIYESTGSSEPDNVLEACF